MSTDTLDIGSYGVVPPKSRSIFEDEGVGNELVPGCGIVVSRIEHGVVYVREWSISSHFEGADALEKFEEARAQHEFEFTFSGEREATPADTLDGGDAALKQQLKKQLQTQH